MVVDRPSRPRITLESPDQPEVIALIDALDAYQATLYPPEACYRLDITALCRPEVLFAVARDEAGAAVGCAAVVLGPDEALGTAGEVKRMYVAPSQRGRGLAQALLGRLQHEALARGCRLLRLETGPYQTEALAFYAGQGFERCGCFGDYPDHPLSVFMAKPLVAGSTTAPLGGSGAGA